MAKTTKWTIIGLNCYPDADGQTDVVFEVRWMCTLTYRSDDGEVGFQVQQSGPCNVSYEEGEPFTPYADLTEAQIWGWVDEQVDRPAIEAQLDEQIDDQITPTQVTPPLPWAAE